MKGLARNYTRINYELGLELKCSNSKISLELRSFLIQTDCSNGGEREEGFQGVLSTFQHNDNFNMSTQEHAQLVLGSQLLALLRKGSLIESIHLSFHLTRKVCPEEITQSHRDSL